MVEEDRDPIGGTLFLVRHAEYDVDTGYLTAAGMQSMKSLAVAIAAIHNTTGAQIYCSLAPRAYQSATILSTHFGDVSVTQVPSLGTADRDYPSIEHLEASKRLYRDALAISQPSIVIAVTHRAHAEALRIGLRRIFMLTAEHLTAVEYATALSFDFDAKKMRTIR